MAWLAPPNRQRPSSSSPAVARLGWRPPETHAHTQDSTGGGAAPWLWPAATSRMDSTATVEFVIVLIRMPDMSVVWSKSLTGFIMCSTDRNLVGCYVIKLILEDIIFQPVPNLCWVHFQKENNCISRNDTTLYVAW